MWVGAKTDHYSEKQFRWRVRLVSVFFVVGYLFLIVRLFDLQIIRGDDFKELSESNRTHVLRLRAPRGEIYDRQGRAFVTNRPSWALMFSLPKDSPVDRRKIEECLRPFLNPFPKRWVKRLHDAFETGKMVRLAEDVPNRVAFGIKEMGDLLPGVHVVMEFRRGYPSGVTATHLIGYLGEIDEKELQDEYWRPRHVGDLIGKRGLEKKLDQTLRGEDGGMLIEVDSIGRLKRVIRELPFKKGASLQLTLDHDIQDLAEKCLLETKTRRGAAVVIDVETGALLAWASSPSFDPSGSLADSLSDPSKPFFDRVYKGTYPPGSLFKIIPALAALEAGKVQELGTVTCKGFVELKGRNNQVRRYGCWKKHGRVDFWRGMTESCDSYFYLLGSLVGPDRMYAMASKFHLGEAVQSILPDEQTGDLPNPRWKRKRGYGGWSTGDTYNMSIGQGFVTATPLQMAVLTATLAGRGKFFKPYVVEKIVEPSGKVDFQAHPTLVESVKLKETTWDAICKAMRLVITKGTGRAASLPYLIIHGKTATAQNPHGEDHAWFIAFAGYPGEEPGVAVCVFVENGGGGGSVAAPIAKKLLQRALPPKPELRV